MAMAGACGASADERGGEESARVGGKVCTRTETISLSSMPGYRRACCSSTWLKKSCGAHAMAAVSECWRAVEEIRAGRESLSQR